VDLDAAFLDTALLDFDVYLLGDGSKVMYMDVRATPLADYIPAPIQSELYQLSEVDKALKALTPQEQTVTMAATTNALKSVKTRFSNQMRTTRGDSKSDSGDSGDAAAGVSTAAATEGTRARETWTPFFEGFTSDGEQDDVGSATGYDIDTNGFILGTDFLIDDNALVGFSISHIDSDIDLNDNLGSSEVETWQGSVFGSYFTDNFHVDGHVGYGFSQIETERNIDFLGTKPEGDHDSHIVTVGVETGYIFEFDGGFSIEPVAGIDYTRIFEEGYTEKNGGDANLEVDSNEIDSIRSNLGVRFAQKIKVSDSLALVPEVSYKWQHEFEDDAVISTASFVNGGGSFKTKGLDPDADHHIIGAGVRGVMNDYLSLYVNYELDTSDSYESNSVMLGVEMKF